MDRKDKRSHEERWQDLPQVMREAPPLPAAVGRREARYALLINPFYRKTPFGSLGKHVLTPSAALTSIAAATPRHWQVRIWDENLLQGGVPADPLPAVVGITVHIAFARRAYELARFFKARGCTVILGGPHVQSCPEEAARHADAIALGNGVTAWPAILAAVEEGNLLPRYESSFANRYQHEPCPSRELYERSDFLTTASLLATRGCRNRCEFCYLATEGLFMPYQSRNAEEVAAEFAATNEPYGVFIDNNLGSNPRYLAALCRALKPIEKIWSAAVTLDITDHPELVREMALSGCTGVFIGFETLSTQNLIDFRKRSPDPADYERRIEIFRRNGIEVNGSFVLGFDEDDAGVFERLVSWIEKARLTCATFHILTPYPGTPLFNRLKTEGRILHEDWDLYDTAHAVFQPKRMSVQELEAGYAWCYERIFSHRSIWERRPERVSSWPAYFGMTYLYKRSNWLWPFLIRRRLTHAVWSPLVQIARVRHLHYRRGLAEQDCTPAAVVPVSPSV